MKNFQGQQRLFWLERMFLLLKLMASGTLMCTSEHFKRAGFSIYFWTQNLSQINVAKINWNFWFLSLSFKKTFTSWNYKDENSSMTEKFKKNNIKFELVINCWKWRSVIKNQIFSSISSILQSNKKNNRKAVSTSIENSFRSDRSCNCRWENEKSFFKVCQFVHKRKAFSRRALNDVKFSLSRKFFRSQRVKSKSLKIYISI